MKLFKYVTTGFCALMEILSVVIDYVFPVMLMIFGMYMFTWNSLYIPHMYQFIGTALVLASGALIVVTARVQ